MNKILIAVAAAVFALTSMFTPSAQAGFKGRLAVGLAVGALSVLAHQNRHRRYHNRRWRRRHHHVHHRAPARKKVYVTKKAAPEPEVAKVEDKVELPVQKKAETENSSITTAALPDADQPAATETAEATDETAAVTAEPVASTEPQTANELDCKKFFPSVGMTLSVPCE